MQVIECNEYERLMFRGSRPARAVRICEYQLVRSGYDNVRITTRALETSVKWSCPLHDKGCLGHIETSSGSATSRCIFLPCTLTPDPVDAKNKYGAMKFRITKNKISEHDKETYRQSVSKYMMGKRGAIRKLNTCCVEGSLKMVISPGTYSCEDHVCIPRDVASNIKVPFVKDGVTCIRGIHDGDYVMLIRQPVLYNGGIQPFKVRVTEPYYIHMNDRTIDINRSMRVPLKSCWSYGADFDGDEETAVPVLSGPAIRECENFSWGHDIGAIDLDVAEREVIDDGQDNIESTFNTISICCTTCWSDGDDDMNLTDTHAYLGVKRDSFRTYRIPHRSAAEFLNKAEATMVTQSTKSALQSEVGYISRRAKIASECISLGHNRRPHLVTCDGLMPISSPYDCTPAESACSFGSPSIRAFSKICSGIMQTTLKIKAAGTVSSISPTLSALTGCAPWVQILDDGTMRSVSRYDVRTNVQISSNLYECKGLSRIYGIDMVALRLSCLIASECKKDLDSAEFKSLVQVVKASINECRSYTEGICQSLLNSHLHPNLRTLVYYNNCCYNRRRHVRVTGILQPDTLVEFMFICNTKRIKGICD